MSNLGGIKMKNEEIIEEILGKCNWWERIIIRRLEKLIIKVYDIARINVVNKLIEN